MNNINENINKQYHVIHVGTFIPYKLYKLAFNEFSSKIPFVNIQERDKFNETHTT